VAAPRCPPASVEPLPCNLSDRHHQAPKGSEALSLGVRGETAAHHGRFASEESPNRETLYGTLQVLRETLAPPGRGGSRRCEELSGSG